MNAPQKHPPNLSAFEVEPGAWGAHHCDWSGNFVRICECGHGTREDAVRCARGTLEGIGRKAFETYNAAVGGVTWDGRPIPGWEAVTDTVRDGWRMAALAGRMGQVIR